MVKYKYRLPVWHWTKSVNFAEASSVKGRGVYKSVTCYLNGYILKFYT